jgi:non-canonical purine NTP pyrophosphatase (RdgB/HAM1 family)
MAIHYITGNQSKFDNASQFLQQYAITIVQEKLKLHEIQSENGTDIALTKVREASDQIREPVFVNDASWSIPALNGFPGPFMKYISKWLTNDDILALMHSKEDRSIILVDVIAYKDAEKEKVFVFETPGILLEEPMGETNGPEITKIISLSDNGSSLAAVRSSGFTESEKQSWSKFAVWLKGNKMLKNESS